MWCDFRGRGTGLYDCGYLFLRAGSQAGKSDSVNGSGFVSAVDFMLSLRVVGHVTYDNREFGGMIQVGVLKIILTIVFIILCVALVVLVLMQEGKSAGLGAISGAAETYWGKNKGRSMEGLLVKITKVLAVLFMIGAVVLNLDIY